MRNAALADRAWWRASADGVEHEWDLGAGSARSVGYHADAIYDRPDRIVSPHTIAGFLPVASGAMRDPRTHHTWSCRAVRSVVGLDGSALWRYRVSDPGWGAQEIQGIDYATMLLGLASYVLGTAFIETHNDFAGWPARAQGGQPATGAAS